MRKMILSLMLLTALGGTAVAQPLLGGFVEYNQALRVDENLALDGGLPFGERAYPRNELRAQLTVQDGLGDAEFYLRFDLLSDGTAGERNSVDLREGYLKLYPASWLDIKIGRQVATWGTGDLVFANDLFAKDWQAFFTGLDDAYLKPPQDLLRLSIYKGNVTGELALSPRFTPDTLPDGSRIAAHSPFPGGMPPIVEPAATLENGEFFARLFGNRGSIEWALYGYQGFWPTPQQLVQTPIPEETHVTYPGLRSGGASLRGPLGPFLLNLESAYYHSVDDSAGDNSMIPNSEIRTIVGIEKSLGGDLMVSGQWYGISMLKHDLYLADTMSGGPAFKELRQYLTTRVTKMALDQNLTLSLFGFYSPTDDDWHLRPSIAYKVTDTVKATLGANLMDGDDTWTQFGQFADNGNVYFRLRYSF
ncbi:MAG: hypothetical protein GY835_00690 [bacterium]|nr:hypothetical protein [bacterium]